jgi:hypothetical protein
MPKATATLAVVGCFCAFPEVSGQLRGLPGISVQSRASRGSRQGSGQERGSSLAVRWKLDLPLKPPRGLKLEAAWPEAPPREKPQNCRAHLAVSTRQIWALDRQRAEPVLNAKQLQNTTWRQIASAGAALECSNAPPVRHVSVIAM